MIGRYRDRKAIRSDFEIAFEETFEERGDDLLGEFRLEIVSCD